MGVGSDKHYQPDSMGSRCYVGIFWVYCVLVLSTGTATASQSGSVANDVTCPALLDTMQALVDAAVGARTRGQFNVAARCLQDAIDQADKRGAAENTVATLHNELGLTLFSDPASGPVPATEHFDRATDVLPTFSNGWFNAGACRASKGEHSEAVDKFVRAIELQPNNGNYHMQHALSLMSVDSEDRQNIDTALASAVEFEPANPMAHNLLGISKVKQQQHEAAELMFQKAVDLLPESAVFHSNLGATSKELDKHEQAVAAFRTALSLEPDKPEHTHGLASALEAGDSFPHDKLKEALILYTTAAKVAPNSPLFHMDLCSAAFKLQEFKEASQACDKGLALAPGHAPLHYLKGQVLQEQGGHDDAALKSFQYAAAIDPDTKQYAFAVKGMGGTVPPPMAAGTAQPTGAQGQAVAGGPDVQIQFDQIVQRLDSLETKVMDKLQKSYQIIDSLQERLELFTVASNERLDRILKEVTYLRNRRFDTSNDFEQQEEEEQIIEDDSIQPIYPPGGKAAFDALMG